MSDAVCPVTFWALKQIKKSETAPNKQGWKVALPTLQRDPKLLKGYFSVFMYSISSLRLAASAIPA